MSKLVRFAKDESGATAIEYGLLAVGIGLAIIGAVGLAGGELDTMFTDIKDELAKRPS